jgi:hypothetical protein
MLPDQRIEPVLAVTRAVAAAVPAFVTVRTGVFSVKVAVTLWAVVMVTMHVPVPVHAPDHPLNVDPVDAAAVRTTEVL